MGCRDISYMALIMITGACGTGALQSYEVFLVRFHGEVKRWRRRGLCSDLSYGFEGSSSGRLLVVRDWCQLHVGSALQAANEIAVTIHGEWFSLLCSNSDGVMYRIVGSSWISPPVASAPAKSLWTTYIRLGI